MAKKSARESFVLRGSKNSLRAEWRLDWDVSDNPTVGAWNRSDAPLRIYLNDCWLLRLGIFQWGSLIVVRAHRSDRGGADDLEVGVRR